ncbi:hypothetical protein DFH06DRAFT_986691 [Mycena polygramma]|nr:hypothetical protein DFH06DRAFT_986691 [Mycena polygramma]
MTVLARIRDETHKQTPTCRCIRCSEDRRARGCSNPSACTKAVESKLTRLLPKWDPSRPRVVNAQEDQGDSPDIFRPPPHITSLTDGFRVFTKKPRKRKRGPAQSPPQSQPAPAEGPTAAERPPIAVRPAPVAHNGTQTIWVSSTTARDAHGKITAGGGVFFASGDERNFKLRVPESHAQSAQTAEIMATLLGVQKVPKEQRLVVKNSKKIVRTAMIQRLQAMEDRGWIGVADREPLKALAAALKSRTGQTVLEDSGDTTRDRLETEGRAEAAALARQGCLDAAPEKVNFDIRPELRLQGVKLSTLTQAIAYAGIKESKEAVSRKASDNNVKQVTSEIERIFDRIVTPTQVWRSIRHRDFSRQLKNFLWKSLHSAHRIGERFWKHIPNCEERGICQFCDEPEDLEHILLKCRRPGQALMWSLAKELWLKKHHTWPELTLGSVLGCGLATFKVEKGEPLIGTARLYRILISETMFAIWKVRNDCVIKRAGEPLVENAIRNKWLNTINTRLQFDCLLTNYKKYGKQNSIKASLVIQTWKSTLLDEENLPDDWTNKPGVLVGIEPKSSGPPSQPSGGRGRGR